MTLPIDLHDWTLLSVTVEWETGRATLDLAGPSGHRKIEAAGIRSLSVDRKLPWGPSVSINNTIGPTKTPEGLFKFLIEMQSGDPIELIAEHIALA